MLTTAIKIAATAFEHDKDKGGTPYIMHLLYVMHKVKHLGEIAMICAVLHDLIEDKKEQGYTFEYLRQQGFSQEVITILELLTHRDETPYMDYIKAIAVHPIAKAVKMMDLEHNSKITRLKNLNKKTFDRMELYYQAYTYLKD